MKLITLIGALLASDGVQHCPSSPDNHYHSHVYLRTELVRRRWANMKEIDAGGV